MKIVIDTNIFISSFFWGGKPRKIFERVINGYDELFITEYIINEIFEVMKRDKFAVNSNHIEDYIHIIKKYSKEIVSENTIKSISRDVDDDNILLCGIAGDVDYIITEMKIYWY
ncbi:MAG: putative toxin-antitoxin system toxin component, PIN family [Treponema sp.]|nr:putative toxin-antitoxin system toxin component, PIN family [Treponema sp.]